MYYFLISLNVVHEFVKSITTIVKFTGGLTSQTNPI